MHQSSHNEYRFGEAIKGDMLDFQIPPKSMVVYLGLEYSVSIFHHSAPETFSSQTFQEEEEEEEAHASVDLQPQNTLKIR